MLLWQHAAACCVEGALLCCACLEYVHMYVSVMFTYMFTERWMCVWVCCYGIFQIPDVISSDTLDLMQPRIEPFFGITFLFVQL